MKTKNSLLLLVIAIAILFTSCQKEDTPLPLNKEDAEVALNTIEDEFITILADLNDEKALSAQSSFIGYGFPTIASKQNSELNHSKTLEPIYTKEEYDQDPQIYFNATTVKFNDYKGTWTYSSGWSKTSAEPTEKVVLIIPFGEGTATLTYSDYDTTTLGEFTYVSHLRAELKISTQLVPVMIWEYTSTQTLTSADNKFVFNFGLFTKTKTWGYSGVNGKTTPTESNYYSSSDWVKNDEVIFAKAFTKNITYNSLDQSSSSLILGNYRVKNLVIKFNINFNQATDLSNPSNYMTISVWTTYGAKVANIIFKPAVAKSEYNMYLLFSDGTEAPLGEYLENLGDDIIIFISLIKSYDS